MSEKKYVNGRCVLCGPLQNSHTFRFPIDKTRRNAWMDAIGGLPSGTNVLKATLCDKHFKKEDIHSMNSKRFRLSVSAVPSLHLREKPSIDVSAKQCKSVSTTETEVVENSVLHSPLVNKMTSQACETSVVTENSLKSSIQENNLNNSPTTLANAAMTNPVLQTRKRKAASNDGPSTKQLLLHPLNNAKTSSSLNSTPNNQTADTSVSANSSISLNTVNNVRIPVNSTKPASKITSVSLNDKVKRKIIQFTTVPVLVPASLNQFKNCQIPKSSTMSSEINNRETSDSSTTLNRINNQISDSSIPLNQINNNPPPSNCSQLVSTDSCQDNKKKGSRVRTLRYPGDIDPNAVNSNCAAACLQIALNCIEKQRKKIKVLMSQLGRANKEIENLRETLISLLEKKCIEDDY